MSLNELSDLYAESLEVDAQSYWSLGSVALFDYCEMTTSKDLLEAANDEAYENLYPFIS